ncbi:MAG TPA: hypothetical protein PKD26_15400 [Pyrinomonadaceae bacterium]|nr:hypothetical protein [Pyrinomonadaceae bacterium]
MKRPISDIRILPSAEDPEVQARTGVSLHCHTLHSKEILDFVPYYAERIPVVSRFWRRSMEKMERNHGRKPDFTRGYWEPPLNAEPVLSSERSQIRSLGLEPLVSITDHDSIEAGLALDDVEVPISMEWTVPFREAFFHIGVHNLPRGQETALAKVMLDLTFAKGRPDEQKLRSLLDTLGQFENVLIVLNHPIWDIEMIGQQAHERSLREFLALFKESIHALEVNGFRSWSENRQVIELALQIGLPVVSGGDRHCCRPNTVINISDAANFAEFVYEVRSERRSRVIVMPEYNVPLPSRQLASIKHILSNDISYGDGRESWTARVFIDDGDGSVESLANYWNHRPPAWTHFAFAVLSLLAHPIMQPILAATIGDNDIGREERRTHEPTNGDRIVEFLNPTSPA